jgi:hypothetical protein
VADTSRDTFSSGTKQFGSEQNRTETNDIADRHPQRFEQMETDLVAMGEGNRRAVQR